MSVKYPIKGDELPFQHDLKYPNNYDTMADPKTDRWKNVPYKTVKTKNVTPKANAGASVKPDRKRKK